MKLKLITFAFFAGSLFLIQTSSAQFDPDFFSQHKTLQKPTVEHSNITPRLVWERQLDSTLVPQDPLKRLQSRLLTPNIALQVKNKSQNNSSMPPANDFAQDKTNPDALYQNKLSGRSSFLGPTKEKAVPLNEGSIDPGIFYAPDEARMPAGIVIKPLKNLDSEMVIDPDQLKHND